MIRLLPLLLLCMVCAAAFAQSPTPQTPTAQPPVEQDAVAAAVPQPRVLTPFVAKYAVWRGGKPLGDATMQVVKVEDGRWRADLSVLANRGLLGIAGANVQQSTLFDVTGDGTYRPLSQGTVRKVLFGRRQTTGVYDWQARLARWQGDVKKTRRGTVPLQDGDMSGLLIDLAVLRDAQPGATLRYRFVDDGRVREHHYQVAQEREPQTVDELSYNAMRVDRVRAGNEQTILWVVEGVPTPIRILQREDDEDALDLRLVEYTGA